MTPFSDNPWFRSLPPSEAEALLRASNPVRLAQGQSLFSQGDAFDGPVGAYFGLASGLVKLSIGYPTGKEVILAVIEPGNWFGAGPVLNRQVRGHSAIALQRCDVLAVSAAEFDALMDRADFAQAIARQMAERLRLAYASMGASASLGTRERIMRLLAVLARGGVTLSDNGRNSISASQDSLAAMLGLSRPTLNKELNALAALGLVTLRYGRIELNEALDPPNMGPPLR